MNPLALLVGIAILITVAVGVFAMTAFDLGWKQAAAMWAGSLAITGVVVTGLALVNYGVTGQWPQ